MKKAYSEINCQQKNDSCDLSASFKLQDRFPKWPTIDSFVTAAVKFKSRISRRSDKNDFFVLFELNEAKRDDDNDDDGDGDNVGTEGNRSNKDSLFSRVKAGLVPTYVGKAMLVL